MTFIAKKPKYASKFNSDMQADFPFLTAVAGNDGNGEVLCTLCNCKIDILSGGRAFIIAHIGRKKHINAASAVKSSKSMTSFFSSDLAWKVSVQPN